MPVKLLMALAMELAYAVFSRTWLRAHATGIEYELLLTALRLVVLMVDWLLFRQLLARSLAATPRPTFSATTSTAFASTTTLPLVLGLALLLSVPLLFNGGLPPAAGIRLLFAATSIVVALREEVVYRGILQTLLAQRYGGWIGLLLSNVIFVLYHYGAQPFTVGGITEVFAMGCVMGLIYQATHTLWAPIALHAIYDALWSAGPLLAPAPRDELRIPLHLLGLALIAMWHVAQRRRAGLALH